jgi:hypothetical protein
MCLHILPSHPDFIVLDRLATFIAIATNPHMLPCIDIDLAGPEQAALIVSLKNEMAEKLDIVVPRPFYEFLKEGKNVNC